MGRQQPVAASPRVGEAPARFRRLAMLVLAAASCGPARSQAVQDEALLAQLNAHLARFETVQGCVFPATRELFPPASRRGQRGGSPLSTLERRFLLPPAGAEFDKFRALLDAGFVHRRPAEDGVPETFSLTMQGWKAFPLNRGGQRTCISWTARRRALAIERVESRPVGMRAVSYRGELADVPAWVPASELANWSRMRDTALLPEGAIGRLRYERAIRTGDLARRDLAEVRKRFPSDGQALALAQKALANWTPCVDVTAGKLDTPPGWKEPGAHQEPIYFPETIHPSHLALLRALVKADLMRELSLPMPQPMRDGMAHHAFTTRPGFLEIVRDAFPRGCLPYGKAVARTVVKTPDGEPGYSQNFIVHYAIDGVQPWLALPGVREHLPENARQCLADGALISVADDGMSASHHGCSLPWSDFRPDPARPAPATRASPEAPPRDLAAGAEVFLVTGYEPLQVNVHVRIERPGKRVVVVLATHTRVSWHVEPGAGTRLAGVLVADGHGPAPTRGLGANPASVVTGTGSAPVYRVRIPRASGVDRPEMQATLDALRKLLDIQGVDAIRASYRVPPSLVLREPDVPGGKPAASGPRPEPPSRDFRFALVDASLKRHAWTVAGPVNGSGVGDFSAAARVLVSPDGKQAWRIADGQVETASLPGAQWRKLPAPATPAKLEAPSALALDAEGKVLMVAGGQAERALHRFDVRAGRWLGARPLSGHELVALAYDAGSRRYFGWTREGSLLVISPAGELLLVEDRLWTKLGGYRDLHLRASEPAFRLAASENQVAIASVNRAGVGAVWSYDLHDKEVKLTWRAP